MKKYRRIGFFLIVMMALCGCATDSKTPSDKPRFTGPHVYQEGDRICAYFEVNNIKEYKKLVPYIFRMPEKPLCRVMFFDFYEMVEGPPYLESAIAILVKYRKTSADEWKLGWYTLLMRVTTIEALGGRAGAFPWGYPKVLRKVSLERSEDKYIGTSYGEDGKQEEFRLVLDITKAPLSDDEKKFLDLVTPLSGVNIKDGKLITFAGSKYSVYNWEKTNPRVWREVKFGIPSIEFSKNPKNYLYRLDVSKFITGYWYILRYKYSNQPEG
jgi:Acetoacetate decarboxylase (ADC)